LWPIKTIAQTNGNNECIYCNDGHIGPSFYPQMTAINSKGLPKSFVYFTNLVPKSPLKFPNKSFPIYIYIYYLFIYSHSFIDNISLHPKYWNLLIKLWKSCFPNLSHKVSDKCFETLSPKRMFPKFLTKHAQNKPP